MTTRIKLRRDTATNWEDVNPVLALGEAGYDTTHHEIRVGDGSTAWIDLPPIGGSGGNILISQNQSHNLILNNNGFLMSGTGGEYDIEIGRDPADNHTRAHIYISQDDPYIRSEVISTTNQNYANDMLWHDTWFSRYSKVTTDAYGVHIKNAQWSGPANEYSNKWTFTKDGIFDLPPRAEIRANPYSQGDGGGASYPVPGDNADRSLTLTANTVLIGGGRLDVAGGQRDGWIASLGPFPNTTNDYWYEATTVDPSGNVYAAGGSYANNHHSIVTKFWANGAVIWNKYIDYDGTPYASEPNSITYNSHNDTVVLSTNFFNGVDFITHFTLDPITGAVNDNVTITNSQPYNLNLRDVATTTWGSSDLIYVGNRDSGRAYIAPDVSGITQLIPTRLVVAGDTFIGNLIPAVSTGTWTMFGTGITGNVAINNINNFTGVTASRNSGSGTGTDAAFAVSYTPGGAYQIQVTAAGTNYDDTDVLKILGTQLGGATPANDLTFHVTTDAGGITGVNTVTGTATTRWSLGLNGNPVDFTAIETPTITTATQQDGFLVWSSYQAIVGNVGYDTINTVTAEYDTTDGYLFIGGRTQLYGASSRPKAYIAKVNMDGAYVEWARCVDDYTAHGGAQNGGEVTGVVCDSARAVISVAYNNDSGIVITKVDTTGTMVWQRTLYTYGPMNGATGIALGDDDSVLITSAYLAYQQQSNWDLLIVKIDKNGNQLWTRGLGTLQNDYTEWENNARDITVSGDYYYINGWSNGVANQRNNNSNGFVAKFNLDGTGVGRFDDFYYQSLDGGTDFGIVANTAANAITLSWRTISGTGEAFNISGLSDISTVNEGSDVLLVNTGGPGIVQGVNEIKFSNGSSISNVLEEGLIMWQPESVPGGSENSEYVGMAFGGNASSNFQPNVMVSAGRTAYTIDDGNNLEYYHFPYSGPEPHNQQVNIDIIAEGGDANNVSNWHFDENGNMYLPAQAGYLLNPTSIANAPVNYGNGKTGWSFNLSDNPKLATLVQAGDFAIDPNNASNMTVVIETRIADGVFYANVATAWSGPGVPAVTFSNQQTNGIVFSDGSKQQTAGRKIIAGYPGDRNNSRSYGVSYNSTASLIWTASSAEINAFRGTVRCQINDSSIGIKLYEVVGGSYNGNGGDFDMAVTPLFELSGTVADPVTFQLTWDAGDRILRIFALAPANVTAYVTCDITEFGYTHD